jgi:hypothetical protein
MNMAAANAVDTGGVSRALSYQYSILAANAGAATTTYGIVIGTGTTPVDIDDYSLEAQVTTNIAHGICATSPQNPDASTWRAQATRTFTNNTGAPLTIEEAAIYVNDTGASWKFCIDRTLHHAVVVNLAAITITYAVEITI